MLSTLILLQTLALPVAMPGDGHPSLAPLAPAQPPLVVTHLSMPVPPPPPAAAPAPEHAHAGHPSPMPELHA